MFLQIINIDFKVKGGCSLILQVKSNTKLLLVQNSYSQATKKVIPSQHGKNGAALH